MRRAVAGFDFTFSIPKSASVLWAVADAGRRRSPDGALGLGCGGGCVHGAGLEQGADLLFGKWRSLDGRPMHAALVALSECTRLCSPTTSPARSVSSGRRGLDRRPHHGTYDRLHSAFLTPGSSRGPACTSKATASTGARQPTTSKRTCSGGLTRPWDESLHQRRTVRLGEPQTSRECHLRPNTA
jgi:TrwC relaxase